MLLIQCSLSLLVVYAGMKLLAKTQKEALGNFHKYVSWLLIVMGFLMFACSVCCGIKRCCRGGERMMERKCRMEMNYNSGGCMMQGGMNCNPMMGCGQRMPMCGHGNGMMMRGGCGGHNMNGCEGNRGGCCEMNEECKDGMKQCNNDDEDSEECPMKKGEVCKKDTLKKK